MGGRGGGWHTGGEGGGRMPPTPPKCGPGSVTNKLDTHTCRQFNLPIFFPDKISSDLLCRNGLKLDVSVKEQTIS